MLYDIHRQMAIFFGSAMAFVGVLLWWSAKMDLPVGKLPGDIAIKNERFSLYFPIVMSIIASIALTIFINFILWMVWKYSW